VALGPLYIHGESVRKIKGGIATKTSTRLLLEQSETYDFGQHDT
jgi:hypothetical protein